MERPIAAGFEAAHEYRYVTRSPYPCRRICLHGYSGGMSDSTTIRVDRATHEELRRLAERDRVTVTETVARAVRALRQDEMGRQLAGELGEDEGAWLDAGLG
jgi:predicted transcriptional regulator